MKFNIGSLALAFSLILTLTGSVFGSDASKTVVTRGIVHMEVPEYPVVPRAAVLQGTIKLLVVISKEGRVLSARVTSSGGNLPKVEIFGPHAVENIQSWIFTEASEETTEEIVYEYRLIARRVFHPCTYVFLESPQHIIVRSEMPEIENSRSTK